MTVAVLAMLQATMATAITAPVQLNPRAMPAAPTAAARALSMLALDRPPSEPVTVTLQCLTSRNGSLGDCIAAQDGGTANLIVYRQRLFAGIDKAKSDPIFTATLARVPFYRVRPVGDSSKVVASVLIREVISSADQAPRAPSLGTVVKGGLKIDPNPSLDIAAFYLKAALRAGAETTVAATCRVLGDRSLLCRDPQVDLPANAGAGSAWRAPAFDADFGQATVRVLATMHAQPRTQSGEDSVGRELTLSINWRLPQ